MDSLILIVRCASDWLEELDEIKFNMRLLVHSDSTCKVYPFVFNFIYHLDRWLLVSMAVEGLISAKFPEKLEKFCTVERGRAVILLLTVLLVTINLHYFWSFQLGKMPDIATLPGLVCDFPSYSAQHSEEFQQLIWPIIEITVSEILPRIIILTCAVVMTYKIIRGRHNGSPSHQQWQEKFTMDFQAIARLKIVILIIAYMFVFLTLPKFGHIIFRYLKEKEIIDGLNGNGNSNETTEQLVDALCSNLEYLFLSWKFVIYFLVSRRFRYEFIHLFKCISCCQKLSFQYQKSNPYKKPLIRDSSSITNNTSMTFDQLSQGKPQENHVETSLITSL